MHVGPALETVARLDGPWDLVFIDADKVNHPAYFDAVLPKLAPRGLIALDNMLQSVVDDPDGSDNVRTLGALNERLAQDPSIACVLLTVRDGVTLVRRTG